MTTLIDIYCDGACSGNPGPGGWAAVLVAYDSTTNAPQKTRWETGYKLHTTNNVMELTAAIQGLKALSKPATLTVISDSKYLIDGMNSWLAHWKANGWRTSKRKPVENVELWQALDALNQTHTITWTWTKGHASTSTSRLSYFNDLGDEAAVKARDKALVLASEEPTNKLS